MERRKEPKPVYIEDIIERAIRREMGLDPPPGAAETEESENSSPIPASKKSKSTDTRLGGFCVFSFGRPLLRPFGGRWRPTRVAADRTIISAPPSGGFLLRCL